MEPSGECVFVLHVGSVLVPNPPPCLVTVKHSGNVTLDQIIDVARTMRFRSMAKTLQGTVKEILGTAFRCVVASHTSLVVVPRGCHCLSSLYLLWVVRTQIVYVKGLVGQEARPPMCLLWFVCWL